MILEDQEISFTKVFAIVGVVIFISSVIYVTILTSKMLAQQKINRLNYAKERIQKPISPTKPPAPKP